MSGPLCVCVCVHVCEFVCVCICIYVCVSADSNGQVDQQANLCPASLNI